MSKTFTVRYNSYEKLCNGYAESCQLCADLVKRGIYPQIVIQYVADDWDEKRVDVIGQNGNEGLHYESIHK